MSYASPFAEALGELLDGADLQVERAAGENRLSDPHGTLVLQYGELDTLDPGPSRIGEFAVWAYLAQHAATRD